MDNELTLHIHLRQPPAGVLFGLQKGGGNNYETVQKQLSADKNLLFTVVVNLKTGKDGGPDFSGPFVHGKPGERFIYLDIGTLAGQTDSVWTRRLKVPLRDITWEMVNAHHALSTIVPGTAKDGGPNCATVKPFPGWKQSPDNR